MKSQSITIPLQIFEDAFFLEAPDKDLLDAAKKAIDKAYAPYSNFRVGAALKLANGKIVSGSNQENASFPAGICAERVTLSTASSLYADQPVLAMALTYINSSGFGGHPISPCGICRQTLAEYEQRFSQPIRLILGGLSGEVYVFQRATDLLPFAFSSQELNPQ